MNPPGYQNPNPPSALSLVPGPIDHSHTLRLAVWSAGSDDGFDPADGSSVADTVNSLGDSGYDFVEDRSTTAEDDDVSNLAQSIHFTDEDVHRRLQWALWAIATSTPSASRMGGTGAGVCGPSHLSMGRLPSRDGAPANPSWRSSAKRFSRPCRQARETQLAHHNLSKKHPISVEATVRLCPFSQCIICDVQSHNQIRSGLQICTG